MTDNFLGEIRMFSYVKNMNGWIPCDGRLLNIQQNTALFALLGVAFGGDGRTTFGIPDLRGRTPMGHGALYPTVGALGGAESVALVSANVPLHIHQIAATKAQGTSNGATNDFLATSAPSKAIPVPPNVYAAPSSPQVQLKADTIMTSGVSEPHNNMQPSLVVGYYIATVGLFPSRP